MGQKLGLCCCGGVVVDAQRDAASFLLCEKNAHRGNFFARARLFGVLQFAHAVKDSVVMCAAFAIVVSQPFCTDCLSICNFTFAVDNCTACNEEW